MTVLPAPSVLPNARVRVEAREAESLDPLIALNAGVPGLNSDTWEAAA